MRHRLTVTLLIVAIQNYSCQKVIELKLKESDQQYVIEGVITNQPGICRVWISKTRHFNDDNHFEGVSGAVVKVTDNNSEYQLSAQQPGFYENTRLTGTPGHTYELSVFINSQHYTASCIMPEPVFMDTLYISRGPFGQFAFPTVEYKDPAGIRNKYRFIQYVNGIKDPAIFWENDEFSDGQQVTRLLDNGIDKKEDPRNIHPGDEVTIEMLTLDEPVYNFWYSLRSGGGAGNSNAAAPSNPLTNIRGGALGYFSAHTIDRKKVIAP